MEYRHFESKCMADKNGSVNRAGGIFAGLESVIIIVILQVIPCGKSNAAGSLPPPSWFVYRLYIVRILFRFYTHEQGTGVYAPGPGACTWFSLLFVEIFKNERLTYYK